MATYSGIVGQIYKQDYDNTLTFTDEASTLQADNRTVIIDSALYKSFKNDKSLFTIKKDAIEVTDSYDLYLDRVIFNKPQTAGVWTISGTYAELETIGGCYEWSVNVKNNVNDKTVFGNTWRQSIKSLKEWSGTAKRYFIDEDTFISTDNFIVRFFWDIDNLKSFYGLAKIADLKKSDKVDGITEEDIDFQGIGLLVSADWALPAIL
jgi:hypothetical protein